MDYLKLAAEIYLRQIGIDAEVTTVPKKKQKEISKMDKTVKMVTSKKYSSIKGST